jgi:RNA polymerase sigma factor (TIGR02999 family)
MNDLSIALRNIESTHGASLDAAFSSWYPELKRIAHSRLYHTGYRGVIQTTALVNEAYIKLATGNEREFASRLQFLAYASRTLRSIIVDTIREDRALRRGGEHNQISLDTAMQEGLDAGADIEAIDLAMHELAKLEPDLARLVEMRFFAGMAVSEIAEALGLSIRSLHRDWSKARLLLLTLMRD